MPSPTSVAENGQVSPGVRQTCADCPLGRVNWALIAESTGPSLFLGSFFIAILTASCDLQELVCSWASQGARSLCQPLFGTQPPHLQVENSVPALLTLPAVLGGSWGGNRCFQFSAEETEAQEGQGRAGIQTHALDFMPGFAH